KKPLPPTTATKSTRRFFQNLTKCHQSNLNWHEIEKYFSEPETEADPLLWWKANSNQFLVLARIAMNFLAVQSTSIPIACVFLCLKSWFTELDDMLKE
ncbi:15932_t:CDS:2, partial [Racocetra persica]